MYSVLTSADRVVLTSDDLRLARAVSRALTNTVVLGPCYNCGHDALDNAADELLCWHCDGSDDISEIVDIRWNF